ncbi:MAG: HD domain-containing protein [Bdellovibrionales bacterium]|nr:HD domain-containing protein [Bdellovibrionales bacterium]
MTEQKRIGQQIAFIAEVDKLKGVLRKSCPIGLSRRENSAEHSWQVILTAFMLAEHANQDINLLKVVQMLAIHDVVEIDTGDTMHYLKDQIPDLHEQEERAARRIFAMLPEDQGEQYLNLWLEFEAMETAEAQFAIAVDRLMAFIMNIHNEGGTWQEFGIKSEQVLDKNKHAARGSKQIWELMQSFVKEAQGKGYFKTEQGE